MEARKLAEKKKRIEVKEKQEERFTGGRVQYKSKR